MDIVFSNEAEAIQLRSFFLELGYEETYSEEQHVFVFSLPENQGLYIDMLTHFIIHVKRGEILHKILSGRFYYEDKEECEQIIEIVSAMCDGKREELVKLTGKMNEFEMIKRAVQSSIDPSNTLFFDSLVTFRLKEYRLTLIDYLHAAIDEYKMEQEYQMFVNMLRNYLRDRHPLKQTIHVSIAKDIHFYDENFQKMKKERVMEMVDRRLLANHPIYIDSTVIAPLLSMAPEKILLYTPNDDRPLIRTLKNIFEERMTILPPMTLT